MVTNRLNPSHLICLLFISCGLLGCTTKVSLTSRNSPVLMKSIDLPLLQANYSKIASGSECPLNVEAYNYEARKAVIKYTRQWQSPRDFTVDHSGVRNFSRINRIKLAETIDIKDGLDQRVETCGVGVPLIARVCATENDCLLPEAGYWIPLTAVVEPNGDCPKIRLIDPQCPCVTPFTLASDFSAPLVRDMHERQKVYQRGKAVFNYDKFAPEMGMKRFFDFAPTKTPLVLVHGIFSSPTTWTNFINGILADPQVRNCYEIWTFEYPTGAPIPYLAQRLREDITAMHQFRAANGAKCNNAVVIGHSMGGLMAKNLTQTSGDAQWKRLFEVSPSALDVSAEERDVLKEMFFFKPLPFVDRVIFVATPHNGTGAVDKNIVKSVDGFIKTPESLLNATQSVLHKSLHSLTPLGLETNHDFPNSIEMMRFGSEVGEIFSDLPLNPCVKYYSVIGNEMGDVPKEEMTDGIVPYTSAHIKGVVSETITPTSHSIHLTEKGIAAMIQILKTSR